LKQWMPASSAARISSRDLPTPENTILLRIAAGGEDARQFAAGDDVETGAEFGEKVEDGEVGVGLDRVADQRAVSQAVRLQRVAIGRVGGGQRGARIDVARGAEARGDVGQRDAFDVQAAIVHRRRGSFGPTAALLLLSTAGVGAGVTVGAGCGK
jgi:hypothetical protein